MSYAQRLCDEANQRCARDDCKWIVNESGGMSLVQPREWTEAYTKRLARRAEADRQQWLHRQKFPVTNTKGEAA